MCEWALFCNRELFSLVELLDNGSPRLQTWAVEAVLVPVRSETVESSVVVVAMVALLVGLESDHFQIARSFLRRWMRLQPPIMLSTVAFSSCFGCLFLHVALVWLALGPNPCDQQ